MPNSGVVLLAHKTDYETHTGTYQILRLDENGNVLWMHTTSHYGLVFGGDLTVRQNSNVLAAGRFSFEDAKHGRLLELSETCRP